MAKIVDYALPFVCTSCGKEFESNPKSCSACNGQESIVYELYNLGGDSVKFISIAENIDTLRSGFFKRLINELDVRSSRVPNPNVLINGMFESSLEDIEIVYLPIVKNIFDAGDHGVKSFLEICDSTGACTSYSSGITDTSFDDKPYAGANVRFVKAPNLESFASKQEDSNKFLDRVRSKNIYFTSPFAYLPVARVVLKINSKVVFERLVTLDGNCTFVNPPVYGYDYYLGSMERDLSDQTVLDILKKILNRKISGQTQFGDLLAAYEKRAQEKKTVSVMVTEKEVNEDTKESLVVDNNNVATKKTFAGKVKSLLGIALFAWIFLFLFSHALMWVLEKFGIKPS